MATVSYNLGQPIETLFRNAIGEPLIDGYVYSYEYNDPAVFKPIFMDRAGTMPYAQGFETTDRGTVNAMYFADDAPYNIEIWDKPKSEAQPGDQPLVSITNYPNQKDIIDITEFDYRNYFNNPEFRKFKKTTYATADLPANANTYIAAENWVYYRNNTNGTNSITYKDFVAGQVNVPDNPKYYLEFECTGVGAGGESRSDVVQIINDVTIFSGESISMALWAESPTSSIAEIVIIQNFGVGGDAENTKTILMPITPTFTQQVFEAIAIDTVNGKNIQDGNYLSIGVRMPKNQISTVRITKLQANRGDELRQYDVLSINQEDMKKRASELPDCVDNDIFGTPSWNGFSYDPDTETGKVELGFEANRPGAAQCTGIVLKSSDFVPGTNSLLTYRRLFDWWEGNLHTPPGGLSAGNGNAFGYGDNGFRPVDRHSNNTAAIRNTKKEFPVTTWTSGTTSFAVTKEQAGADYGIDVFASFNTAFDNGFIYTHVNNSTISIQNKLDGAVTDATVGTMPAPFSVAVQIQGSPTVKENTRISYAGIAYTTTLQSKYWTFNTPSAAYYVWHKVNGIGTDPSVGGRIGILVEFDTLIQAGSARVASEAVVALQGTALHQVVFAAASTITGGQYLNIYNDAEHYTPYYIVDGVGAAPSVVGSINIPIKVVGTDDAETVMNKSLIEIKAIYFTMPDPQGMVIRITDYNQGRDPDLDDRDERGDGVVNRFPGTVQTDDTRSHRHRSTFGSDGFTFGSHEAWHYGGGHNKDTTYTGGSETRMVNININLFVKV